MVDHITNLYDPEDWWCWNEPIWHRHQYGIILGNELRWRQSKDIVEDMRASFPDRELYKDPYAALMDFVVTNWAWRVNWPVRNHPGELT